MSALQSAGERELAELIVTALNLEGVAPADIDPEAALFKTGLGLDSIDALEIVLELQRSFGVVVSDEQMGQRVLRSVRTIVDFIESTRVPSAGG